MGWTGKKEGQGSALDPLGPAAPDPHNIGFAATRKSRAALNGVWGLRPRRVQGRALAFLRLRLAAIWSERRGTPPRRGGTRVKMFDFSWSEIMVIGLVALVLIGPKDLPIAIRAITRVLKKMRRMAGEFQHHVDDMMREADLGDVQSTFRDLRGMNLKSAINSMVDADGTVARAFADPFTVHPVPPTSTPRSVPAQTGPAPDFIPPASVPRFAVQRAPDFMPPSAVPPEPVRTESDGP